MVRHIVEIKRNEDLDETNGRLIRKWVGMASHAWMKKKEKENLTSALDDRENKKRRGLRRRSHTFEKKKKSKANLTCDA